MNTIHNIKTANFKAEDGRLVGIVLGLDIADLDQADPFMLDVAEKFKAHRMISPPETAGFLVTIIGEMSASEFARRWTELASTDGILAIWMGKMRMADVVRITPAGQKLESVSLLRG